MGRKNLLDLTLETYGPADQEQPERADPRGNAEAAKPKTQRSGVANSAPAISGLRDTMRQLGEAGVQDLDPAIIDGSDYQDRLSIDDESVAELAESIRRHGQQVPILVRPIPGKLNRYQIVYGRRRLAAIRLLGAGQKVKAIVRSLDDKTAILAQGQENSLRLDPSFIEKAVFIGAMIEGGYDRSVIQDALGISRQSLSQFTVVLDALPFEVISVIGPAHDIGRRPWTELAHMARQDNIDLEVVAAECSKELELSASSSERFEIIMKYSSMALAASRGGAAERSVNRGSSTADLTLGDGRKLGRVRTSSSSVEIQMSLKDHPEFGQWISKNADRIARELHDRWQDERGGEG